MDELRIYNILQELESAITALREEISKLQGLQVEDKPDVEQH